MLTYQPGGRKPSLQLPEGACDSHVHVIGPVARFPYATGQTAPCEAAKDQLAQLHERLGISRCVVVQPVVHGFDNGVTEDAICGPGADRVGIALVPVDVPDGELARLSAARFRGVRFNFMAHLPGAPVSAVLALTARLAPLGMHLQVHLQSGLLHQLGPAFERSQVPVVIDHLARVDASRGPGHADFVALRRLLRNPLFRVKVSGIDRAARHPPYLEAISLARMLVEEFPERCLWGSDWPHPNHTHVPDDALLADCLELIAPDAAARKKLLVTNPADFFDFDRSKP